MLNVEPHPGFVQAVPDAKSKQYCLPSPSGWWNVGKARRIFRARLADPENVKTLGLFDLTKSRLRPLGSRCRCHVFNLSEVYHQEFEFAFLHKGPELGGTFGKQICGVGHFG